MSFTYGTPLNLVVKPSHSSNPLELFKDGLPAFFFHHKRISCFNCLMISLPCTINLTFICIVGVSYLMMGCMVLSQCSWRNINCALGKIRSCLISVSVFFPCPFKQCFNGGFCRFVYQISTHLFMIHSFIL